MKKIILSATALMGAISIQAIETPTEPPVVKHEMTLSGGTVSGQIKAMHIITDKDNNWTPNSGSGYLGTLKYETQDIVKGLKAGAAFYINGDTGLTDWGEYPVNSATDGTKPAQGMFTSVGGEENSHLGQAYLEYNSAKDIHAKIGRMILNTPLTKIQWSLMPNFYEAGIVSTQAVPNFSLTLAHITKMSYGSRSATDWSLIGEKTGTAGVARPVVGQGPGTLEQAKFIDIGTALNPNINTDGITALNATYKGIKNLRVSIWDYYAYDIANMIYADVNYKIPVMKSAPLALSAQYLSQGETGDKLGGDLDYTMYGVKAKIGNKKYAAYIAYNQSTDDGKFLNAWGADPAYTSSLFSRNAYRQDVGAYKIGGHYTIMKGLKFKAGYANYGQSKTMGGTAPVAVAANEDATELDLMLIYKPAKAWTFKIFNVIRTSEYNSNTTEYEMNHVRLVAWYDF